MYLIISLRMAGGLSSLTCPPQPRALSVLSVRTGAGDPREETFPRPSPGGPPEWSPQPPQPGLETSRGITRPEEASLSLSLREALGAGQGEGRLYMYREM